MAKLNLYEDSEGREYVAIITQKDYEDELNSDASLILKDSAELTGDYTAWPTDRFLVQE